MITAIIGPMGGGKSSELARRIRRAIIANFTCVAIKYAADNRYNIDKITTHDKIVINDIMTINATDLAQVDLPKCNLLVIDEAQFMTNVAEKCQEWLKAGQVDEIVIAMLNADYQNKPFANLATIIAAADNVLFLRAVCARCGKKASRTVRLTVDTAQEIIGGFDLYSPRCRKCQFV